jgi:hypothetical protein
MKNLWPNGRCRGCHGLERNSEKLNEIKRNFAAQGNFYKRAFVQLLNDLESRRLERLDVRMLERFANQLISEEIEPQSWSEARELSARLAVCYSRGWKRWYFGCPILKVAAELEKEGKIKPDQPFGGSIDKILWEFDSKTRRIAETYLDKDNAAGRNRAGMFHDLARLKYLYRFLDNKSFFPLELATAQAFIDSRKFKKVNVVHEWMVGLKRFYRWAVEQKLCQSNPFEGWYPELTNRTCEKCRKKSYFEKNDQLCDRCHVLECGLRRFDELIGGFRAPSPYNQHLLELYASYTRRLFVSHTHRVGARTLIQFLEAKELPVIRSWGAIFALSKELARTQTRPIPQGCPFIKIGWMLQELGVIAVRQMEKDHLLENLYSRWEAEGASILRRYSEHLLNMKYATGGRYGNVRTVFEFQLWLNQNEPGMGLFTASERVVISYLQGRNDRDRSGIRRKALRRFYRWAKRDRLTLLNPVEKIPIPKVQRNIFVCSESQIRQIEAFVKSPESHAEYAFLLALVLYWGVTSRELTMSTIEIHGAQIWINLYRQEVCRGRRGHNREQVLKLPPAPQWLASLQKRYIQLWSSRFETAKKVFPVQPLILGGRDNDRTNRFLSIGTVIDLFYKATIAATGERIPPSVVRRTSGHIHTHYGDASRLTKLGWSKSTSTDFSVLPRRYFSRSERR